MLSDVGGPYIIAPAGGTLRYHGKAVAHYLLSVQDDLGYVKLVSRYLGYPLTLRDGSRAVPIEGLAGGAPANIPDHGPVGYRHGQFEAFSFNAKSFPNGGLRVSLLVPVPGGLSSRSCAEIRADELGRAAERVSRRFSLTRPLLPVYAKLTQALTGTQVYIRRGSHQYAGSTRTGPARLPATGSLDYHGVKYDVSSFHAPSTVGDVRVYILAAHQA